LFLGFVVLALLLSVVVVAVVVSTVAGGGGGRLCFVFFCHSFVFLAKDKRCSFAAGEK
jgi:hypothetical protein